MIALCNGSGFEELQRVAIRDAPDAGVELVWIYTNANERQQLLKDKATNVVDVSDFLSNWIKRVRVIALHNKVVAERKIKPIENAPILAYLLSKTNNDCVFLLYSRGPWVEMERRIQSVNTEHSNNAHRISFWGIDDNAGHLFDLLCDADHDQSQTGDYFWAIGEAEYFLKKQRAQLTQRDIDRLPPFSRRLISSYQRINKRISIAGMSPTNLIADLKLFVSRNAK